MRNLEKARPFALWAALALAVAMCSISCGNENHAAKVEPDHAQARRLEGEWFRPDGGYLLVIEDIQPDGKLTASYYNPQAINVHAARWTIEDGRVHLYVELRDRNYPGSKYSVAYVPDADALVGTYYQAVEKLTFDIRFIRKEKGK